MGCVVLVVVGIVVVYFGWYSLVLYDLLWSV